MHTKEETLMMCILYCSAWYSCILTYCMYNCIVTYLVGNMET